MIVMVIMMIVIMIMIINKDDLSEEKAGECEQRKGRRTTQRIIAIFLR